MSPKAHIYSITGSKLHLTGKTLAKQNVLQRQNLFSATLLHDTTNKYQEFVRDLI